MEGGEGLEAPGQGAIEGRAVGPRCYLSKINSLKKSQLKACGGADVIIYPPFFGSDPLGSEPPVEIGTQKSPADESEAGNW